MSHRLPMARAARDAGFEVHVATRVDRHGAAIEAEGFHLHPISWRRGSLDPRDLFRVVREVRKLYRMLKPDLAHHVALPAAVVGSLAATGLPVVCLNAMTGLGTMFISDTAKVRTARAALTLALRRLLNRSRSAVLVQNLDDRALIERLGVRWRAHCADPGLRRRCRCDDAFAGAGRSDHRRIRRPLGGVEGNTHACSGARAPQPARPRYPAADRRPAGRGKPDLDSAAGDRSLDAGDPMSRISASWKTSLRSGPRAHIAVLPSHREGLPLSLLEAAACGRPLDCDRRAGMPRYRASRRQRVSGAARRCRRAR